MNRYRVQLIFQGKGNAEDDPSLTAEVDASDEVAALQIAKVQLMTAHINSNYSSIWCWHIENLSKTPA